MKKSKVLVLGATGMLGSMVEWYLGTRGKVHVTGTSRKVFDAALFLDEPKIFGWIKDYDYLINCIGIIKPYCKDDDASGVRSAIQVNALFPHVLSEYLKGSRPKTIQIATDCVYSGANGPYDEMKPHDATDVYGKTKSLGEVFDNDHFLNIRCSIIGPERKGKLSLLEWLLAQPKEATLNGFTHHQWNGVTTMQFAQLCEAIILKNSFEILRKHHHTLHYLPNQAVDKYQLLTLFSQVFKKPVTIVPVADIGPAVDRRLTSSYDTSLNPKRKLPLKQALVSLREVMKAYYAAS